MRDDFPWGAEDFKAKKSPDSSNGLPESRKNAKILVNIFLIILSDTKKTLQFCSGTDTEKYNSKTDGIDSACYQCSLNSWDKKDYL